MIVDATNHNVNSSVREIVPGLAWLMGVTLAVSFVGFLYVALTGGKSPMTGLAKTSFSVSLIFFVLTGIYWKGFWTWVLKMRAEKLAQRHDYFEINEDELEDLRHCSCEYTGRFVEFRGIHSDISPPAGRVFVNFDNEQDRIIFRLANR